MTPPSGADRHLVGELVRQALRGEQRHELVEGAFVDRYEPVDALAALADHFAAWGVDRVDAEMLRDAIRDVGPTRRVGRLVRQLARLPPESVAVLADDPEPALRRIHEGSVARRDQGLRRTERELARGRESLRHPDPRVRVAAVARLARLRYDAEATREVLAALEDPDPSVRSVAATAVGDDPPADADAVRAALRRRLDDPEPAVRRTVVETLDRAFWDADAAEDLVGRLSVEAAAPVQVALLGALTRGLRKPPPRGLPAFVAALRSQDQDVRLAAACGLHSFGPAAAPALVSALEDPADDPADDSLRRVVVGQLERVGARDVVPVLAREFARGPRWWDDELHRALRITAARPPAAGSRPADPAAVVRRLIETLPYAEGGRPDTLPVAEGAGRRWAIGPDGAVLSVDRASGTAHAEADDVAEFAVKVRAAMQHPELRGLVPQGPWDARICGHCRGTGESAHHPCPRCDGLGWTRFERAGS